MSRQKCRLCCRPTLNLSIPSGTHCCLPQDRSSDLQYQRHVFVIACIFVSTWDSVHVVSKCTCKGNVNRAVGSSKSYISRGQTKPNG